MMLKLDMEKAFDRVSWKFLRQALLVLGFPPPWIGWIFNLVTGSSFAILFNGTLSRWVSSKAGIR